MTDQPSPPLSSSSSSPPGVPNPNKLKCTPRMAHGQAKGEPGISATAVTATVRFGNNKDGGEPELRLKAGTAEAQGHRVHNTEWYTVSVWVRLEGSKIAKLHASRSDGPSPYLTVVLPSGRTVGAVGIQASCKDGCCAEWQLSSISVVYLLNSLGNPGPALPDECTPGCNNLSRVRGGGKAEQGAAADACRSTSPASVLVEPDRPDYNGVEVTGNVRFYSERATGLQPDDMVVTVTVDVT